MYFSKVAGEENLWPSTKIGGRGAYVEAPIHHCHAVASLRSVNFHSHESYRKFFMVFGSASKYSLGCEYMMLSWLTAPARSVGALDTFC